MQMPLAGFRGPFRLTPELVDERVLHHCAGAYALGVDNGYSFAVHYVGRTGDMADSLLRHAGMGRYRHFKFSYMPSAQAAFEQECRLYHTFSPPDNSSHPERPADTNWQCPHCASIQSSPSAVSRARASTSPTQ